MIAQRCIWENVENKKPCSVFSFRNSPIFGPNVSSTFISSSLELETLIRIYGVMQSDWNSIFCDVVLNSVNLAFRDEDNIFDK